MIISELIDILQKHNSNLMVVISGYGGGVTEVKGVQTIDVLPNYSTAWYYGEHEPTQLLSDKDKTEHVLQIKGLRH